MSYKLQASPRFLKELKKMDKYTQKMIKSWIIKNLENCENPRSHGKSLTGNKSGYWRYRIGDYRLICEINDNELVVLTITIGHRSKVYEN